MAKDVVEEVVMRPSSMYDDFNAMPDNERLALVDDYFQDYTITHYETNDGSVVRGYYQTTTITTTYNSLTTTTTSTTTAPLSDFFAYHANEFGDGGVDGGHEDEHDSDLVGHVGQLLPWQGRGNR